MKIPYGTSDFRQIRSEGFFYADKTPFLPLLESAESGYRHLLFLRPRRFGKSTLLSMLEHYYDLGRAEQLDQLFKGLWVHEHPTPERSKYLVLPFDFSQIVADGGRDALREGFAETVKSCIRPFIMRYADRIPELRRLDGLLDGYRDGATAIGALLGIITGTEHMLYVLIDEYDNFANRLLSGDEQDLYESVVRDTGFVRSFYAALKAGTRSGAVARMFITGVSPILLDDLSSGFNILTNISQHPRFNALAGLTHADVERAVGELFAGNPALAADPRLGDREQMLETLEQYYDGYRFARKVTERVFNPDMVLYFLRELENKGEYPANMLDLNVRTDYGRLQRIGTLSGTGGAKRRALLEAILADGYVLSELVEQFGARSLRADEQLISLLYYMGMLTIGPQPPDAAVPRLEIPNRVIRELQWDYLALMLKEQEQLWLDTRALEAALGAMAVQGDIGPLVSLFQEQVVQKLGVKDQRQFNEKTLKLMLLAYISHSRMFRILSEKEFARGYCDLFLGLTEDVPAARFAWMLELKYLPTDASRKAVEAAFAQAEVQLERYASDRELVPLLTKGKELRAGTLVFVGAREVLFRAWPGEEGRGRARTRGDGRGQKMGSPVKTRKRR